MVLGPSNRNCACKARLDFELGPAPRVVSAPVPIRLAQRKSPWRCSHRYWGPAYFWDLFVPFHAGLAGEIAETRAETYDVAKRAFSRVAAAVEALEAEGWRVVKKGILPGQCTSDARHKGSPGPVRARIVFARRAPARDSRLFIN